MRPLAILLSFCLLIGSIEPATAAPIWDTKRTYALVIGILEWRDKELASFPKKNRQDRALVKALQGAGVPSDQIVYLEDKQATLAAIRTAMDRLMARSGPGSTLLIYFTGHGIREGRQTYLANYDIDSDRSARTGLAVGEIGDRLARSWKGSRLLMLVDCCHSGAVAAVVQKIGSKGKAAACLTSATASNESTGNWTFTEAIVKAVQGDGRLDRNRDRQVTFDEVDAYVHDQMKYGEDQLTHGVRAGGFETNWRLSGVPAERILPASNSRWKVGDYLDGYSENDWYRARVLKVEPNRLQVRYVDYDEDQDEWLPLSKVRPIANTRFATGQRVQIEWEGEWYAGRIVRSAENYFHFVSYDDFDDDAREWVTDRRLRAIRVGH